MTAVTQTVRQGVALVRGWSVARRVTFALALVGGIGLFAALVTWGNAARYAPLLSGLSEADAAAIVESLEQEHVPYRLAAGGSAILVDAERVHAIRLRLAASGLPRGGGVGFEIFDEPAIGTSRFAERLNYRRALEGELARTIRSFEAIRDARVHVVMPERTVFAAEERRARAAVTVHLHAGRVLAPEQVQAIVHLVSSSVADLTAKEVTVVDGRGNVLARGGEDDAGLATALQQQRALEQRLERRLSEILSPVVGEGQVAARVSVDLDLTESDTTTEAVDPDRVAIKSEQTSDEERSKSSSANEGIPGVRSNIEGGPQAAAALAGRSGRRTQTRNYEVSKTLSREVRAAGRVGRLTVAVLVNQQRTVTSAAGTSVASPYTTEELARMESLAKNAVGFDARRGDQLVIQAMPFAAVSAVAPLAEPLPWLPLVERWWLPVVTIAALIAFLTLLGRRLRAGAGAPLMLGEPRTVREIEATLGGGARLPTGASAALLGAPAPQPEVAAAVLKDWLGSAPAPSAPRAEV